MAHSRLRHDRWFVFMQANLVWKFDDVDAERWIDRGLIEEETPEFDPDMAKDIAEYTAAIQKAGRFLMPEEVYGWTR